VNARGAARAARVRAGAAYRALRLRSLRRRLAGPRLIRAFARTHSSAFFVEIGSNDGEQHDHLRRFILSQEWAGIMVEPVPYVFERLRRNYAEVPRVILENAAIAERDGRLPFYYLVDATVEERSRLPDWYDGIGSFRKETVLSHVRHIPDIERRLVCTEVPALTFDSLCDKHGADRVDLLVVDTEGYDWEIIRHLDFSARRPELMIYEHYHLDPADRRAAAERLHDLGYETMEEGFDTFCLDAEAGPRLRRAWDRLRPAVPGVSVHDE
jgi:FkbM family methyltransferase